MRKSHAPWLMEYGRMLGSSIAVRCFFFSQYVAQRALNSESFASACNPSLQKPIIKQGHLLSDVLLWIFFCYVAFKWTIMYICDILVHFMLRWPYLWHFKGIDSNISRRQNLTTNFLIFWLLKYSPPLFHNIPWDLVGGLFCRCMYYPLKLDSTAFWLAVIFCNDLALWQRKIALMKCDDCIYRENPDRHQHNSKNYRQLMNAGNGGNSLPPRNTHQLITQYQKVSPAKIHRSNSIQTEWFVCVCHTHTYIHIHACNNN